MKKRLYMIIALLYCGSVLSGCSMSQESMSGDDKENNNIKVEKTVDDNKGQKKQEQQVYNMYTAKIKDYPEQIKPSDFFPENSDYKEIKKEEVKIIQQYMYKKRQGKIKMGYGRILKKIICFVSMEEYVIHQRIMILYIQTYFMMVMVYLGTILTSFSLMVK